MKTLFLFRHGKSTWDAGPVPDRERGLAPRGVKAARRMGRFLARAGPVPDRVLCSPAVRTAETLRHAADAGAWRASVEVVPELYGASCGDVLACLPVAGEAETVVVVGHEPSCSETLAALIGGAAARFPTAALACVRLDVARWDDVTPGRGELLWLVTPRLLARLDGRDSAS